MVGTFNFWSLFMTKNFQKCSIASNCCVHWLRFMSHLVEQKVGMFLGIGEIYRYKKPNTTTAPHFFAYDAGRRILVDRAGEVNLLDETDLNQKGINKVCQNCVCLPLTVMNGLICLFCAFVRFFFGGFLMLAPLT